MSQDLKRISVIAIVFLVLARISIGWQFMYEGLWKHNSLSTPQPWSAQPYLANARGPFRGMFQNMLDDPYGLDWLDQEKVIQRWKDWQERFTAHYELSDTQQTELEAYLNGRKEYAVPLARLPEKVKFDGSLGPLMMYRENADTGGQIVIKKGKMLLPAHFRKLKTAYVKKEAEPEYFAAIEALEKQVAARGYVNLLNDLFTNAPEWSGQVVDAEGKLLEQWTGKINAYKEIIDKYEVGLATARQDFQQDHLRKVWSDLQQYRNELIPPVKQLDRELREAAQSILNEEQQAKGPLPPVPSKIQTIDQITIWSLLILGGLLMIGFLTRIAALAGAGMLVSFYLVYPPWPGVPPAPGPEHALFVNKNIIEAVTLLAFVFLPSGSWFGVDGIFRAIFGRKKDS